MDGKYLGKIAFAEYGILPDREQNIGLRLGFTFGGAAVCSGETYVVNLAARNTESEIQAALMEQASTICAILTAAKCNSVSELKGKPVEVTVEKSLFKTFRILTEVL
jgi:hypothetical protein